MPPTHPSARRSSGTSDAGQIVDALPEQPLSKPDLDAIEATDAFDAAVPLTWTGLLVEIDPEERLKDDILQLSVTATDGTTYALSFDPTTDQWVITARGTLDADGDGDDEARDRLVRALGLGIHGERLREYYGDELDGLADDAKGWDDV